MLATADCHAPAFWTGEASLDDPDVTLVENYSCNSERNFTNYCNSDVEKLISAQSRETDLDARKRLVWQLERKLVDDTVRPVIAHLSQATCWYPHVKGLTRHVASMHNNWRLDVWFDK